MPFDVIYGRTGRLYSTGNAINRDHMHIIDTTSHTWIGRFGFESASTNQAEFAITSDKRYLYVNEPRSSTLIHGFDVQTDTVTKPYESPAFPVGSISFTISPDGTKVFTSNGEVLSGDLQTLLGTLEGIPDFWRVSIKYIPGKNAVAYTSADPRTGLGTNMITFSSAVDYHLISTYVLPEANAILDMDFAPDGSKMIVNYGTGTSSGKILIVNLSTFPPPSPATPTPVPTTTPEPTNLNGSRKTYTLAGGLSIPGRCSARKPRSVARMGRNPDADHAHQYPAETYAFYKITTEPDSFKNRGARSSPAGVRCWKSNPSGKGLNGHREEWLQKPFGQKTPRCPQ